MLGRALSLYLRNFASLVLTCALALGPASLLGAGAVRFGIATLGGSGMAEARTHTQQVHEKKADLNETPPQSAAERDLRVRQLGREAVEGGAAFNSEVLRGWLPAAYATAVIALLLLAGIFLAHAAAVPVVQRKSGPAHAWAAVASRIGPLVWTGLLGAVLVAVGALFFIIPGIALAAGFSFAAPAVMLEGISGRAALERSWRLMHGHWGAVLAFWALIVIFSLAASAAATSVPPGPLRPLLSALVRVITYPLPIVGLVLVYQRARAAA